MSIETFSIYDVKSTVKVDAYIVEQKHVVKPLPTVIICPGGGYVDLSSKEGKPVAITFNELGYNAFVLSYSVKNNTLDHDYRWPEPLLDLATTVLCLKNHANDWNVDVDNVYLCGFSAGGHLVAMYATCWKDILQKCFEKNKDDLKIKAAILIYPVVDLTLPVTENDWRLMWGGASPIDDFCQFMFGDLKPSYIELKRKSPVYLINENTFPCFIVHAQDDSLVNVIGSLKMGEALKENGVPFSLHVFQTGNHGFVLGENREPKTENSSETYSWIFMMDNWIKRNFF